MLRLATIEDIEDVLNIIRECQQLMRQRGIDQWQNGYPNRESIVNDIIASRGYILVCNNQIAAYAALIFDGEEAYSYLKGGEWLTTTENYLTIHRLAVSDKFRGQNIGESFFLLSEKESLIRNVASIRCDTHKDNRFMLRLLKRLNYTYCGQVSYQGAERVAFEKILILNTD